MRYLKAIEIENFKCFGKRVRIPLAPITLIYGENSAGKSTIIQVLNLLKQSRERASASVPLLLRCENGLVDLGGFHDVVHDHDPSKELCIRMITEDPQDIGSASTLPDGDIVEDFESESEEKHLSCGNHFEYEVRFKRDPKTGSFGLSSVIFDHGSDESCDPSERSWSLNCAGNRSRDKRTICQRFYRFCDENLYGIFRRKREKIYRKAKERGYADVAEFYARDFSFDEFQKWCNTHPFTEEVVLHTFLPENEEFLFPADVKCLPAKRKANGELHDLFGESDPEIKDNFDIEFDPEDCVKRPGGLTVIPNITGSLVENFGVEDVGNELASILDRYVPLAPVRMPLERLHLIQSADPDTVGYRGEFTMDLLVKDKQALNELNLWMQAVGIDYELQIEQVGDKVPGGYVPRFVDKRRMEQTEVSVADVGYGVSQILPFLVQSLACKNSLIAVEQPEVHVHPRLQAEMGYILYLAIEKCRNNRFIIETHSEHLMLRIQKLMRKNRLKPEDVCVLYVSRGEDGSNVQQLRLDKNGEFLDQWPEGFFPERLNELLGE